MCRMRTPGQEVILREGHRMTRMIVALSTACMMSTPAIGYAGRPLSTEDVAVRMGAHMHEIIDYGTVCGLSMTF